MSLAELDGVNPQNVEAIAVILQRFRQRLTNGDPEATLSAIAKYLGRSEKWVKTLYTLSGPDFRRALRSKPKPHERTGHEMIYPETGWLGDYLLYCQESESPLGWHFWCGVFLLGLVARRNFYWDRGRYFLFLNHYVFLLGPSGLTKSTTISQAMGIFEEMTQLAQSDGMLAPIYQSPERITPEKMLVDLSNWAKYAPSQRKDTILCMVSDELATLLGRNVKGADRLADFLTDIYLGKRRFRDSTIVGGDRTLLNVAVSCLFASTASSVRRNITEGLFTEGFMARVVTASRNHDEKHGNYATPPPSDPVLRNHLATALVPWLMLEREVELRLTADATTEYDKWYVYHQSRVPSDEKIIAFWKRKPDHLHKLMGVLALSEAIEAGIETVQDGMLEIDSSTFEYALLLLELEEERLPEAFSLIGAKDEAQDILKVQQYIEKKWKDTGEPVPHTQVFHNCRHIIKSGEHLRQIISTLVETEIIRVVQEGRGRRLFYRPFIFRSDGQ